MYYINVMFSVFSEANTEVLVLITILGVQGNLANLFNVCIIQCLVVGEGMDGVGALYKVAPIAYTLYTIQYIQCIQCIHCILYLSLIHI